MSINKLNHAQILVKGTLCLDYLTLSRAKSRGNGWIK